MKVFISGTDTDVGKTLICSWLALHTGYDYFKPIQTGPDQSWDRQEIEKLANTKTHKESYICRQPLSPHIAAAYDNINIELDKIFLPKVTNLIVEGAGGLLVPLNKKALMIDLISHLNLPVILVTKAKLGTINHSLLSIEALKRRNIPLLGVIFNRVSKKHDDTNEKAVELYGQTKILARFPEVTQINRATLEAISLTTSLRQIF